MKIINSFFHSNQEEPTPTEHSGTVQYFPSFNIPEEIKNLKERVWQVISSIYNSITLRIVSLYNRIFGKPEPKPVSGQPVKSLNQIVPKVDQPVVGKMIFDFDHVLKTHERELKELQFDVVHLVIQSDKHLTRIKAIQDEIKINIEVLLDVYKVSELPDSSKTRIKELEKRYHEVERELKVKIGNDSAAVIEILKEMRQSIEANQILQATLADLELYLQIHQRFFNFLNQADRDCLAPFGISVEAAIEAKKAGIDLGDKVSLNGTQPGGLRQIGNSCYIAASVQAILASSMLTGKVMAELQRKSNEKNEEFEERQHIHNALRSLMLALQEKQSVGDIRQKLVEFRRAVFDNKYLNGDLSIWKLNRSGIVLKNESTLRDQHDAAQLMNLILEVIGCSIEIEDQWWVENHPRPPSNINPCRLLQVPIGSGKNLQQYIDGMFQPINEEDEKNKRLLGVNGAFKLFAKWTTRQRIIVENDVLVIQLKRFGNDLSKNCEAVALPGNGLIDLSCAFDDGTPRLYRLASSVRHTGGLGGGHYVAHARYSDRWFEYDDGIIRRDVQNVDQREFQNYLLVFERVKS